MGYWGKKDDKDWFIYPDVENIDDLHNDIINDEYLANINKCIPHVAFEKWFKANIYSIYKAVWHIVAAVEHTDVLKVDNVVLPQYYTNKIKWFRDKYGARIRDWKQLLIKTLRLKNNQSAWKKYKATNNKKSKQKQKSNRNTNTNNKR